ncbi:MAG: VOC family protein [Proteobacteria bacterium]|nr:VOC family protein [Pseudomonadota bacterium]
MARAIDHLVICGADLGALARLFETLRFQVGPVNRHPWGTENRIIQLGDRTFLELVHIAEPGLIPPHQPKLRSFGAYVGQVLKRGPGLGMIALAGKAGDNADFSASGIGGFDEFNFSRKGRRPDGSETEVAFTLANAEDKAMPEAIFFSCLHHFSQNFWAEAAQRHVNGATGIARVTMVAENPSDHHIFLAAFIGEREMRATSFGIEIEFGPNGKGKRAIFEVLSREGFAFRYGCAAPQAETPVFAGFEIETNDPAGAKSRADAAGIPALAHAGGTTLPPRPDFLTALRFVAEGGR